MNENTAAAPDRPMLEIEGLSKSYPASGKVISGLSLQVGRGEIFFLIGPSGCGKSTLLRLIAGFLNPDSGSIRIGGRDVAALPPEARRTAMVFQNYALWPHMDVAANVGFAPQIAGKSRTEVASSVIDALRSVRMEDFGRRKIQSLSGGQQQRVALARAMAADPQLLLLDEPLSNLDAKLRDTMRLEIRRILRERSLTALYVTHDRREAMSIADRIAVLNSGHIEQIGTPQELYLRPANRFVAGFLGQASFLRGRAESDHRVATESGVFETGQTLAPGEELTLMMRPESWQSNAGGANRFEAVCIEAVFLGEKYECRIGIGKNEFLAALPADCAKPPRPGATLKLSIPPSAVAVLKD